MFCQNCGKEIDNNAGFCYHCGSRLYNNTTNNNIDRPLKSQFVAIVCCMFFGFFGLHNFYLEEYMLGFIKIGLPLYFLILGDFPLYFFCLFCVVLFNLGDFILIIIKAYKLLLTTDEQNTYMPPRFFVLLAYLFYLIAGGLMIYKGIISLLNN